MKPRILMVIGLTIVLGAIIGSLQGIYDIRKMNRVSDKQSITKKTEILVQAMNDGDLDVIMGVILPSDVVTVNRVSESQFRAFLSGYILPEYKSMPNMKISEVVEIGKVTHINATWDIIYKGGDTPKSTLMCYSFYVVDGQPRINYENLLIMAISSKEFKDRGTVDIPNRVRKDTPIYESYGFKGSGNVKELYRPWSVIANDTEKFLNKLKKRNEQNESAWKK